MNLPIWITLYVKWTFVLLYCSSPGGKKSLGVCADFSQRARLFNRWFCSLGHANSCKGNSLWIFATNWTRLSKNSCSEWLCLSLSVFRAKFLTNWMLQKERKELAIFSQDRQLCNKANLICSGTVIWKEMEEGMKSGLLCCVVPELAADQHICRSRPKPSTQR